MQIHATLPLTDEFPTYRWTTQKSLFLTYCVNTSQRITNTAQNDHSSKMTTANMSLGISHILSRCAAAELYSADDLGLHPWSISTVLCCSTPGQDMTNAKWHICCGHFAAVVILRCVCDSLWSVHTIGQKQWLLCGPPIGWKFISEWQCGMYLHVCLFILTVLWPGTDREVSVPGRSTVTINKQVLTISLERYKNQYWLYQRCPVSLLIRTLWVLPMFRYVKGLDVWSRTTV
jgi:hypothetical protein